MAKRATGTGPADPRKTSKQAPPDRPAAPSVPANVFLALQILSFGAMLGALGLLALTLAGYDFQVSG